MCGIFACISREDKGIDEELLLRAGDKMGHRGPDNQNGFIHNWIGMLHNRLSIIDLSERANQPMFSPDKRYAIVYNGEIYNYKELRKELIDSGFNFGTQSDTEVLLNAYIKFSSNCLNKLRGMFAFVIVDFHKDEVFIARDHFGIKPLYLYISGDYIIFSSEIKPISEFAQLEPNYDVYYEQIMFRYTAGKNTCFRNIKKVLPGHFYIYKKRGNRFEEHNYYKLSDTFYINSRFNNMNEDDIINEAEEILTESIKIHTYSDVGYNLELSGGVDSSLIAAILTKSLNFSNLRSYSIVFPEDKEYDESKHQNVVANILGIKNYPIEMTNELFCDILEEAAYFMEIPLVHIGCACLFLLTGHSYLDSKVILTGEGADEVFGGYGWYNINWRKRISYILDSGLWRNTSKWSRWGRGAIDQIMSKEYLARNNLSYRKSLLNDVDKKDIHTKLLYYDQMAYLTSLLNRQDKMSMAHSVEARVPYCDKKVYEFMNSVPVSLKFKNKNLKYILKKIAGKYLPKEIIYKPKIGLNLPFKEWLKEEKFLGKYLDMLLDETTKKRGIYNTENLRRLIKTQREGKADVSIRLMVLIVFELWHRIFFDKRLEPKISGELAQKRSNLLKAAEFQKFRGR